MSVKLIIQISCLNESEHLPVAVAALPRVLPGVDVIETLIVDDGSTDGTSEVARKLGIDHIIRHNQNRGLLNSVNRGMLEALMLGADILVNTDADNQYCADDIVKLVQPILEKRADLVLGERPIEETEHFSFLKKKMQRIGSRVVSWVADVTVRDTASAFRALNREAMCRIVLLASYAPAIETSIQVGHKKIAFLRVPIRTNPSLRPSRLFKSPMEFVRKSMGVILDNLLVYRPLQVFGTLGIIGVTAGVLMIGYRIFLVSGPLRNSQHLTLVFIAVAFIVVGVQSLYFGLNARINRANRKLLEEMSYRQNRMIWDYSSKTNKLEHEINKQ